MKNNYMIIYNSDCLKIDCIKNDSRKVGDQLNIDGRD